MLNLRDRIKGKNENKEYTRTRIEVRDRLLAGEMNDLQQALAKMPSCSLSFPNNNNYEMNLIITPKEGMYYGGTFEFEITVPMEYNNVPPIVKCKTRIWHPNINEQGAICLSVLRPNSLDGHGWMPTRRLIDVIHGLDALFGDLIDFDDPLNSEAATQYQKNIGLFKTKVQDYIYHLLLLIGKTCLQLVKSLTISTIFLTKFHRRNLSCSNIKKAILSNEFYLDKEWSERHNDMKKLSLGGGYEWIASVQKKFMGGGKASAVDVDAAVCGAEEKDQINDIMDLIYKLRHTDNASDFLPSTEYAALRLLLKYNATSEFFKILNDPINYGVFLNEHLSCLAIDYFINRNDFNSAARIASIVMQQEMFDSQLLNHLSVYSLIKFIELPAEERKMSEELLTVIEPFEEDDECPTFRYPYLKNNWNDNHFDIKDSDMLVSKSLELFIKVIKTKDSKMKNSLKLTSYIIGKRYDELVDFLEENSMDSFNKSSLNILKNIYNENLAILEEKNIDKTRKDLLSNFISKIDDNNSEGGLLSDEILNKLKEFKNDEETKLSVVQKNYFKIWNSRREELLKSQAERLKLQLRLQEIDEDRKKLNHEKENMSTNRRPGYLSNDCISSINFISEKISESLHILDHDPSLALYQIQVHIHKTLPKITSRKYKMIKINEQLDGACFDIDNSKDAVNCMLKTSSCLQLILCTCQFYLYINSQLLPPIKRKNGDISLPTLEEILKAVGTSKVENDACEFQIYGKLMHSVMYHKLFNDSKTFVDKPLKYNPNRTMADFLEQFPETVEKINREKLITFVNNYFYEEGHELENCTSLDDWSDKPEKLINIKDDTLRSWALKLNLIWKNLCRSVKDDVNKDNEKYSLIYVPNNFIIPGGRFREFYYWDTYWIIKGLLKSGMYKTAKGIIENFFYIIKKYSFIPNGGRIYYLKRSQPALLTSMVDEYYTATKDINFLFDAMPILETELSFWEKRRTTNVTINGNNYVVFQYRADSNVPRPESYFQDVNTTKNIKGCDKKREIWKSISSTAESGWDFSTRFLSNFSDFSSFQTTDIVEVDINAILCSIYGTISKLYSYIEYNDKSKEFEEKYNNFMKTFKYVFYNSKNYGWYDYNKKSQKHNFGYYPSNLSPLYWKCFGNEEEQNIPLLYNKLKSEGVFSYRGGLPTSLYDSNQQWDLPNGWSPTNHMVIIGLSKTNNSFLQDEALKLAKRWILSNFRTFKKENAMFEKYNVVSEKIGHGGGGEYDVQEGFGWTNGVILDLLTKYKSYYKSRNIFSRPLKNEPEEIINEYKKQFNSDLKGIDKRDWTKNISNILEIKNESYKEWGQFLHNKWKDLCYQFDEDVKNHPIKYSSIYLPNKFIASDIILEGNRMWDIYYIVKGLLVSKMYETSKGMIGNLLHLIDIYGYIPYGYRIYHLKKTTVPLLALTVNEYFQHTNNLDFLKKALPYLEKEFLFWEKERSVSVKISEKNYTGFRYQASPNIPRVENFYSDYNLGSQLSDCDDRLEYWKKLQTISESSQLSYRWITYKKEKKDVIDTNILPIELNSILCNTSGIIANFYKITGNNDKFSIFTEKYTQLKKSFKAIFYNASDSIWYDFSLQTSKHKRKIYPYSFFPVFLKCYGKEEEEDIVYMYERIKRKKFNYQFSELKKPYITKASKEKPENLYFTINQMIIEGLLGLINEGKKIMNHLLENSYMFFKKYYSNFSQNVPSTNDQEKILEEYGFVNRLSITHGIILDYLVKYESNAPKINTKNSKKTNCSNKKPTRTFEETIYITFHQILKRISNFFIYIT
uniref:Trehalase n=1 Tax=Strongyloides stercoralis TaxID=6248 RepID=A0AAF5DE67_STRER